MKEVRLRRGMGCDLAIVGTRAEAERLRARRHCASGSNEDHAMQTIHSQKGEGEVGEDVEGKQKSRDSFSGGTVKLPEGWTVVHARGDSQEGQEVVTRQEGGQQDGGEEWGEVDGQKAPDSTHGEIPTEEIVEKGVEEEFRRDHEFTTQFVCVDVGARDSLDAVFEGRQERGVHSVGACAVGPEDDEGELVCVICYDGFDFDGEDEVVGLPCLHLFHFGCIREWLHRDTTCPTCKVRIAMALQLPS